MRRLLAHCGVLETVNDEFHFIKDGFVGIDGDTIVYVGDVEPSEAYDEVKDMSGKLVMPGLINTHTHTAMTLLRGVGSDLSLQSWLFDTIFPIEERLTLEDFKAGYELALLEMIASGTTSFTDMYMEPEICAKLVQECGIKANLCRVMAGYEDGVSYEEFGRGPIACSFYENFHNTANGRLLVDFSVHAEYTNCKEYVEGYVNDAKKMGARMHIHMSETKHEHEECKKKYGMTPAEWFDSCGLFDLPTHAAHCVWVEDSDLELMKKKGVSVAHNPTSNMKLGSGFAPIQKMLDMGINVTIGTDGTASNNNLNMFEEMHLASVIHNGYTNDPTIVKAKDVVRMATVNGAKLQGRNDTGSIEVGKKADLIALDLNKPHLKPNLDAISLIAYSAQGSDVCMTMVDGTILYENGQFMTLDEKRIYQDVEAAVKRLYNE